MLQGAAIYWTILLARNEMVFDNSRRKLFLQVLFRGNALVTGHYHKGKKKTRSESYNFVTVLEISSPVSVNTKTGSCKYRNGRDKSRKREGQDGIFSVHFHP